VFKEPYMESNICPAACVSPHPVSCKWRFMYKCGKGKIYLSRGENHRKLLDFLLRASVRLQGSLFPPQGYNCDLRSNKNMTLIYFTVATLQEHVYFTLPHYVVSVFVSG
jgi:hypothetical protein